MALKGEEEKEEEKEKEEESTFEIFIDDLLPSVKEKVIKFLGDNGNYDVFPMITLYKDGGEE